MLKLTERLTLRKKHRWFYATHPDAEEWDGPFNTLESVMENAINGRIECDPETPEGFPLYIAQARVSTVKEQEEFGVDWKWWIETETRFVLTAKSN